MVAFKFFLKTSYSLNGDGRMKTIESLISAWGTLGNFIFTREIAI